MTHWTRHGTLAGEKASESAANAFGDVLERLSHDIGRPDRSGDRYTRLHSWRD